MGLKGYKESKRSVYKERVGKEFKREESSGLKAIKKPEKTN